MKKLTLNQAWKLCLRQWKWIIAELDRREKKGQVLDEDFDIDDLKSLWMEKKSSGILCNCFFCQYSKNNNDESCSDCPGKLVNRRFDCFNKTYHYMDKPRKFYAKLLELDAKRRFK